MEAKYLLEPLDLKIGTASLDVLQGIVDRMDGDTVPPDVMYELTGVGDQWGTLRSAFMAAGCVNA